VTSDVIHNAYSIEVKNLAKPSIGAALDALRQAWLAGAHEKETRIPIAVVKVGHRTRLAGAMVLMHASDVGALLLVEPTWSVPCPKRWAALVRIVEECDGLAHFDPGANTVWAIEQPFTVIRFDRFVGIARGVGHAP
jgi:hypothetical protein